MLTLARGEQGLVSLRIEDLSIGVVRELRDDIAYDPYWLEANDPILGSFAPDDLVFQRAKDASLREDADVIDITAAGGVSVELRFRLEKEGSFGLHVVPASPTPVAFLRVGLRTHSGPLEAFYGLGGHLDDVNQRGKRRSMQMEPDLGLESASNEAHVPVPLLIGTSGFGVFVESDRLGVFDVANKEDDLIEFTYGLAESAPDGLRTHLFVRAHPLDILNAYYDVTARPILPAEWAYGPWIWRDENEDQAQVLGDIRKIRELDLATSAIWVDRPYASAVNTFDFDAARFPNPAAMISAAHEAGLRMALWSTPYLEASAEDLLAEAKERGFFPPQVGANLNHWGDPIDFSNPSAFLWWQGLVRRYTSLGIEGFKLDYGEDIVASVGGTSTGWRFFDGSTERTMHHHYPLLYHEAYAETLPETGGFLLGRAGRFGDQATVSVIWPGDLDAGFARHREKVSMGDGSYTAVGGLPASVVMGLSLSASGFPFFGADTGGYRHSPPDEETFVRWFQQTALSAVMQVGDSSSQTPWEFTPENGRSERTLDGYRTYARLHLRLFPYAWTYAKQLGSIGHPIIRPFGLAHPEVGVHPSDVYFFGADLLVAPVVDRGARERSVPFPGGEWVDWWTGEVTSASDSGGSKTVDAPLEKLPLFVRRGAMIPMLRPDADTLAVSTSTSVESVATRPGALWVRATRPVGDETFEVFDGTRLESHPEGAVVRAKVSVSSATRFEGTVFEWVGAALVASVKVDGQAVSPERTEELGGTVRVSLPPGTHELELTWPE